MSREPTAKKLEDSISVLFHSLFCHKACDFSVQQDRPAPSHDVTSPFLAFLDDLFSQSSPDAKERLRSHIRTLGIDHATELAMNKLINHFDQQPSLSDQFIRAFLKHQKWHETQVARCVQALKEKPKFAAKIKDAMKDHVACLPSSLALLQCLQQSKSFSQAAKQSELVNKLFNHVTSLFELDSEPLIDRGSDLNLNKMILLHGQQANGLTNQRQTEDGGTQDGDIISSLRQLESGKSPEKYESNYNAKGRLQFNLRANSEPPTEFANQIDEESSSLPDESKEAMKLSDKSGKQKRVFGGAKVPPIMVNRIQHGSKLGKNKQGAETLGSFHHNTSSSVMNSFFNMPLQQMNKTQNQVFVNGQNPAAFKNSQYKFHSQKATLAHSRMTRRQMSMSRQSSCIGGGSNKNILHSGQALNFKHDAARYASLPPQDKKDQQDPYHGTEPEKRRSSKTPVVPPINFQKLANQETGATMGTPFQQTLTSQGVNILSAQNATSKSNNAYIANNFYLPGRSSVIQNTKSSSPQSGDKESRYNNSFDGPEPISLTAEQKLQQLATQLGESCLTNDLAALMSQKRDFDLAETARKSVMKKSEIKRSQSLNVSKMRQLLPISAEIKAVQNETALRTKRLRVVLLNAIETILAEYTNDEARFLKQPIALFNCYFASSYFRRKRAKKQVKRLTGSKEAETMFVIDLKGQKNNATNDEATKATEAGVKTDRTRKSDGSNLHTLQKSQKGRISVLCQPEVQLVSRLLSKFSFVNEEILRSQVVNELKNFTSREKYMDLRLLNTLTGYSGYQLHAVNQSNYLHPPSISPTKFHNRSQRSFDNDYQDTLDNESRKASVIATSKHADAMQLLKNPNYFWASNGVAYELVPPQFTGGMLSAKPTGHNVSPSIIRKKLDVLLYHTSRSIRYIFTKELEVTSVEFARAISVNIVTLSAYLEEQTSRTLIHQFIEVCLEPVLMIKKALIDVALRSNLLVMDFSKSMPVTELLISAKGTGSHANDESDQTQLLRKLMVRQRALRELFAEFLLLVSYLLRMPHSIDTLRLFNETLVFDELWQEAVKTFTISHFLCDLFNVHSLYQQENFTKRELNNFERQTLEELRGVNIVSFDQDSFEQRVAALNSDLVKQNTDTAVKRHFVGAVYILTYFKSVTNFFKQATGIFFVQKSERQAPKPQMTLTDHSQLGGQTSKYSGIQTGGIGKDARKEEKQKEENSEAAKQAKYWKHVIRRTLFQLMFLLTHPNGLFFQYLQLNAVSYRVRDTRPINMRLTKLMLGFMRELFSMPHTLTKFVFDEELLLFYIRTHFISLVKLYHKGYSQSKRTQSSLSLCKKHVECLFAIARNRTEETRRKLFQFKIVQFLLQEIGLEYELQQRRERFLKLSKQHEQSLAQVPAKDPSPAPVPGKRPPIPALKTGGLGLSTIMQENGKTLEENDVDRQVMETNQAQVAPQKKPVIPMLKTNTLGLSTLVKENGLTAEEQSVQELIKPQEPPQVQKKPFIPSLKTGGLGFSTILKEGGKTQEELDVESQIKNNQTAVVPVKKTPFIPMLKTGGLGLSTIIKDGGKTQEELDVESQIKAKPVPNKHESMRSSTESGPNEVAINMHDSKRSQPADPARPLNNDGGDSSDSDHPSPAQQPQQKSITRGKIPQLKVQGLGFSNLIKEGGKTQEEIDVEKQIKFNKVNLSLNQKQDLFVKNEPPVSINDNMSQMKDMLMSITDLKDPRHSQLLTDIKSRQLHLETEAKQTRGRYGVTASQAIANMSPINVISGFASSSIINSQALQSIDIKTLKMDPNQIVISEGKIQDSEVNMLSSPRERVQPDKASVDKGSIEKGSKSKDTRGAMKALQIRVGRDMEHTPYQIGEAFSPEETSKLDRFIQLDRVQHDQATQQKKLIESERKRLADDAPQSAEIPTKKDQDLSEEVFYLREREERPLYQDEDLHVLMLALMMCLLLKPQRGTLDELYCSQFPILNEDQNVLYLLHFHLSHPHNKPVIPKLLRLMEQISPPLAGSRLLKLLCPSLFDLSLYNNGKNWRKIAEGAYGIVYECQTNLKTPQTVAIKQMHLPQSIQDRCVLHDIFTEITCLEEFRLEPCVTDLYDYGVDTTSYYIVMKKYAGSIKDWRVKQKAPMQENLSLYLSIYKEILRCFQIIHSHNVTHYDIKCDNVLIDFKSDRDKDNDRKQPYDDFGDSQLYSEDFSIAIADFGECYMYTGERDAYSNKNRGTDAIKSPEMLLLAINTRKETDKYDRRKREGTNSLSDVWSLGCLLFELLTGTTLFETEEYIQFHVQLTSHNQVLLTPEKLDMINNNVYLVDFLKYILVRDMRLRPTIQNVIKRFEHVHALLVSTSTHTRISQMYSPGDLSDYHTANFMRVSLSSLLEKATKIILSNTCEKAFQLEHLRVKVSQSSPQLMRIFEDVFFASYGWIVDNMGKAIKQGVTHLVIQDHLVVQELRDKFDVFEIPAKVKDQNEAQGLQMNAFLLMPGVMDFIRRAALFHGRILFVEESLEADNHMVRECMLMCLSTIYQTNAYETYTLIKSQQLFFQVHANRLVTISKWVKLCSSITHYLTTYPRFSCICGSCVFVLKRQFANYSSMPITACHCTGYYRNVEGSQCPSTGCQDFIQFLKTYFKQHLAQTNMLADDNLHWGYLDEEDFVAGPNFTGQSQHTLHRQLIGNLSMTADSNCVIVGVTEKTLNNQPASVTPGNTELVSRSSATRRTLHFPTKLRISKPFAKQYDWLKV